jgi:hypothetical protein
MDFARDYLTRRRETAGRFGERVETIDQKVELNQVNSSLPDGRTCATSPRRSPGKNIRQRCDGHQRFFGVGSGTANIHIVGGAI